MVTAGKINTLLVEQLQKAGVNAFGLSGVDGRLLVRQTQRSHPHRRERASAWCFATISPARSKQVNAGLLQLLVGQGLTPVIRPLAISAEGDALNVDADRAAAMIAGAVKAEQLILLDQCPRPAAQFPG